MSKTITAPVDLDMLTMALQAIDEGSNWWLDTESGEVMLEVAGDYRSQPGEEANRYIDIEPITRQVLLELMESFIATIDEPACCDKLYAALEKNQADWHFKQALAEHPQSEDNWYAFKNQFYALQARQWLRDRNLEYQIIASDTVDDAQATNNLILLSLDIQVQPLRRFVIWQTIAESEIILTAYEDDSKQNVMAECPINTYQLQAIEQLLKQEAPQLMGTLDLMGINVSLQFNTAAGVTQQQKIMCKGDWLDQLQASLGLILALPPIEISE